MRRRSGTGCVDFDSRPFWDRTEPAASGSVDLVGEAPVAYVNPTSGALGNGALRVLADLDYELDPANAPQPVIG